VGTLAEVLVDLFFLEGVRADVAVRKEGVNGRREGQRGEGRDRARGRRSKEAHGICLMWAHDVKRRTCTHEDQGSTNVFSVKGHLNDRVTPPASMSEFESDPSSSLWASTETKVESRGQLKLHSPGRRRRRRKTACDASTS